LRANSSFPVYPSSPRIITARHPVRRDSYSITGAQPSYRPTRPTITCPLDRLGVEPLSPRPCWRGPCARPRPVEYSPQAFAHFCRALGQVVQTHRVPPPPAKASQRCPTCPGRLRRITWVLGTQPGDLSPNLDPGSAPAALRSSSAAVIGAFSRAPEAAFPVTRAKQSTPRGRAGQVPSHEPREGGLFRRRRTGCDRPVVGFILRVLSSVRSSRGFQPFGNLACSPFLMSQLVLTNRGCESNASNVGPLSSPPSPPPALSLYRLGPSM